MILRLSLIAILCGLLSACAQLETLATPNIGMANPATQFCLAQGKEHTIQKTSAGEKGLCRLPNGQTVDEWAYFRQHQAPKLSN
ncbi:MAG: DUF333 domain-containing protein [Neisseriaceae bacterium]|nr:DUF333 domain-containing protein [Neisseriaceae bacterium]MBP6861320.1 DUF333 domain-containing protein [Neisseriaceae bacterium]